jgi:hypothetical protein
VSTPRSRALLLQMLITKRTNQVRAQARGECDAPRRELEGRVVEDLGDVRTPLPTCDADPAREVLQERPEAVHEFTPRQLVTAAHRLDERGVRECPESPHRSAPSDARRLLGATRRAVICLMRHRPCPNLVLTRCRPHSVARAVT